MGKPKKNPQKEMRWRYKLSDPFYEGETIVGKRTETEREKIQEWLIGKKVDTNLYENY